ncbi:MAG: DUF3293 domain-containing protein [Longimicrobiaceae bacterium]
MRDDTAAKLRAYCGTVLEFPTLDPPLQVDLRAPVPADLRGTLAAAGLATPFAIITAFNPRSEPTDEADNQRRDAELTAQLGSRSWLRADGCSPDRSHREPGVAVALSGSEARELAVRFDQDAFFWFDGARFWIRAAAESFGPVRLPCPGV